MKQVLEIGPSRFPDPRATVRIDVVPNPNANYVMNAEQMLFPDNSVDRILMFECLEHMESPLRALREICRVLKPQGDIIFSVPNVYYYRLFLRWAVRGKVSASPEHLWNWSSFEITRLCDRAGLQVESIAPYNEGWNNKQSIFYHIFPRIAAHSIKITAVKPSQ
jgi:ubiquinone/menaquinone biosynthesis C-methylase UbiE